MARLTSILAPLRRVGRAFWITFLFAGAISEGSGFLFHKILRSENESISNGLLAVSGFYQWLVSLPRAQVVKYTAVVEIDPATEIPTVSDADVCSEREFLARLLDRMERTPPKVIVLSKHFRPKVCDEHPEGTEHLVSTVNRLRRNGVFVIVGLRANSLEAQTRGRAEPTTVLEESLPFYVPSGTEQDGIGNPPEDTRRLPLEWSVYQAGEGTQHRTTVVKSALALVAALSHDPYLIRKNPLLNRLYEEGEQPFMGFLPISRWTETGAHFYASEVLCGKRIAPNENWENCKVTTALPAGLRQAVVVIGETDPDQMYPSVAGELPDFYLQANYIDALLDGRFLKPAGPLWDNIAGLVFLFALELILIVWRHRIGAAVTLIGCLLLISYLFLYIMVVNVHYYVDPVPVEATAVFIKIVRLWSPSPEGFMKRARTASAQKAG